MVASKMVTQSQRRDLNRWDLNRKTRSAWKTFAQVRSVSAGDWSAARQTPPGSRLVRRYLELLPEWNQRPAPMRPVLALLRPGPLPRRRLRSESTVLVYSWNRRCFLVVPALQAQPPKDSYFR